MWKEILAWFIGAACVIFALGYPHNCKAEETSLSPPTERNIWAGATFRSIHFDRSKQHNENNRGAELEYRFSDSFGIAGGEYRNSLNRHSNYYGVSYHPFLTPDWQSRLGIIAGFVSGYADNPKKYNYGLIPSWRIRGIPFVHQQTLDNHMETNLLVSNQGVALRFYFNFQE